MISKLKVIFFFPPVQQVRVKLIVDFHTDIDFKLGKLRVGGRGMFSDRGDSAGPGETRTEDRGYQFSVLILHPTQNSFPSFGLRGLRVSEQFTGNISHSLAIKECRRSVAALSQLGSASGSEISRCSILCSDKMDATPL